MKKRLLQAVWSGFLAGVLLPTFIVGTFESAFDLGGISRTTYWETFPRFYGPSLSPGRVLQASLGVMADSTNAHRRWFDPYVELGVNWIAWTMLFVLLLIAWHRTRESRERKLDQPEPERQQRPLLITWTVLLLGTGIISVILPVSLVGFLVTLNLQSISELSNAGSFESVTFLTFPGRMLVSLMGLRVRIAPFDSAQEFWLASMAMFGANFLGWFGVLAGINFAAQRWRMGRSNPREH